LSGLTLSAGTLNPVFAAGTTNYAVSVSTASITVTPTLSDANASMTVNGTVVNSGSSFTLNNLTVGSSAAITIIVTAQDGTTKQYTITVTRLSNDATLSGLTLSAGTLAPPFDSGTISYAISVDNAITSITVTPTTSNANATMTVNGTVVNRGGSFTLNNLTVGLNAMITIIVTAQDGATETYTISVARLPSSIITLSNLTLSSGTLTPSFNSSTLSYVASVSNATTSITVTPTATDPTEIITIGGVPVRSGNASGPIFLSLGRNTINVLVTAQNGLTTTYSIIVTRLASADATLANLAISSGTLQPGFSSGTIDYTASVENTVTSISVTPTTADTTATIKVNGAKVTSGTASTAYTLAVGDNVITTIVTAQDGRTTETYTVTVNRAQSSIASLSNLSLSSGSLNPVFSPLALNYSAGVTNTTTSITVTPTLTDPTASVTVNGKPVASGFASASIPLAIGANTVTVVVTAQNGNSKNIYTVIVTRTASSTATLSNLTISSGTLAPNFNASLTSYAVSVPNAVSSITVTPTATDPNATITVNGTAVASGRASTALSLRVNSNNIVTVVVRAQDGNTVTYTITVSRTPPTSVVLANLTISSGSLAPNFSSTIFSYASAVANTTTSLTVTATTSDPTNTITVNGIATGSGTPSAPIPLHVNANVITVIVSAPGGVSTTYTITVARAGASIATLSDLTLSQGTLKPVFSSGTKSYTASVDNIVSSITVTPTTTDTSATIKVKGVVASSGQPSQVIALAPGDNTITVDVLAQDGITTTTYTVVVTRTRQQSEVTAGNLLTPNGDGKNDTWFIKNIDLYPNNTVTVFDRSGKIMFTKKGYNNDWDGNYNGEPLKEDTYYYVIDLGPGDKKVKGYITVLKRR
jgi:gliding motility-associated-like protein